MSITTAIGFWLGSDRDEEIQKAGNGGALKRVLGYFPWLDYREYKVGTSTLGLWGHHDFRESVHTTEDGTLLALIRSPVGDISWPEIEEQLDRTNRPEDFKLPWDGRVILLRISADGEHWTIWNDWCGSIPVFHTHVGEKCIASTLEPVVVAAARYTPNDFFLPGVITLLLNGQYLGEWTLFKDMKVLPADCVAEWDSNGFKWQRLWTVKPSDGRWDKGWDELVDEMYDLSRKAIADVLKTQSSWILPLSGGLDSRLIATVGAEMGIDLHTYSYVVRNEDVYASQVARVLELPWKPVELGTDFLAKHTRMWADWFGSALHFHGMYQIPFLEALKHEPSAPMVVGFLGEALAGLHLRRLVSTHADQHRSPLIADGWHHWSVEELRSLLKFPIDGLLEQVRDQVEREINVTDGALFQKLLLFDLWTRQRLFISYQPTMYSYWRGCSTPYHNREYARFCLSLPRLALEDRRLQGEMFRRCYPNVAVVGGNYAPLPFIPTKRFLLSRSIAWRLPHWLRLGPLSEFKRAPNTLDRDCVRAQGNMSLWPVYEAWGMLDEWIEMRQVGLTIDSILCGELQAVGKLKAIQPFAYRLLNGQG